MRRCKAIPYGFMARCLRGMIIFFALYAFSFGGTVAAQTKVYSEVDPKIASIDDVFQFVVTVEGDSPSDGPVLSGGEDFDLRYIGPETRVTVIDGDMRQARGFVYQLIPKKAGKLETPSAEITVNNQKFTTQSHTVEVRRQGATATGSEQIFFRQVPSPSEVYLGEQIVLSLDLYHSVPLVSADFVDLSFDNFWSTDLGSEKTSQKYLKGSRYTVHRLQRALFPLSAGKMELQTQKIRVSYREQNRFSRSFGGMDPFSPGFFDRFFSASQSKTKVLTSNTADIRVKPLPPAPIDFPDFNSSAPIVGTTKIELKASSGDIKVGESKSIEIIVRSYGNLGPLNLPAPKLPSFVKVYSEKPDTQSAVSRGKLKTTKIFRYSLVGIGGGEVAGEPVRIGYFDPEEEKYKIEETEGLHFSVIGPKLEQRTRPESKAQRESSPLQPKGESPGDPNETSSPESEDENRSIFSKLTHYVSLSLVVYLACLLLSLLFIFWLLHSYIGNKEALARSSRELSEAQSLSELSKVYESLLRGILPDIDTSISKLGLKTGIERNVNEERLRSELMRITEQLDAALYSGASFSDLEKEQLLRRLKHRILDLLPLLGRNKNAP